MGNTTTTQPTSDTKNLQEVKDTTRANGDAQETKQPSIWAGLGFRKLKPQDCKHAKLLLYGLPGAGKTTAIASIMHRGYKVVLLDYDNGRVAMNKHLDEDSPAIWQPGTRWSQLSSSGSDHEPPGIFQELLALSRDGETFEDVVLVIDTLTNAIELCNQENSGAWAATAGALREFIRLLPELNINVVLTARAKQEKTKGKESGIVPDLIPSVWSEVLGGLDQILHLKQDPLNLKGTRRSSERWIWSDGGDEFVARDRLGFIPNRVKPDLGFIINVIRGVDSYRPAQAPEVPNDDPFDAEAEEPKAVNEKSNGKGSKRRGGESEAA